MCPNVITNLVYCLNLPLALCCYCTALLLLWFHNWCFKASHRRIHDTKFTCESRRQNCWNSYQTQHKTDNLSVIFETFCIGLKVNSYDLCNANKIINGFQWTSILRSWQSTCNKCCEIIIILVTNNHKENMRYICMKYTILRVGWCQNHIQYIDGIFKTLVALFDWFQDSRGNPQVTLIRDAK